MSMPLKRCWPLLLLQLLLFQTGNTSPSCMAKQPYAACPHDDALPPLLLPLLLIIAYSFSCRATATRCLPACQCPQEPAADSLLLPALLLILLLLLKYKP
jgi:hypothetical protein